jgi:carbon starvation protein CstA
MLTLALMAVTIAAGLMIRFAPLGLPSFIVKYGGSTMWALMAYWIVSTFLPSWRLLTVALLTGTLTTAVEFVKLYHSPILDTFRLTLPGIVLLGRFFSVWDIVAYWFAISVGALVDRGFRPVGHAVHSE